MVTRFRGPYVNLWSFGDVFLVHCPRCAARAEVVRAPAKNVRTHNAMLFAPRRLVCKSCGHIDFYKAPACMALMKPERVRTIMLTGAYDWFFHLPLWLQISCCGNTLWAYNEYHLDYLKQFVEAKHREFHPSSSMVSRLPKWMKSAKNRDEVLKCIARLENAMP